MPEIKFDSKFLKIGVNIEEGDVIRFLDEGYKDDEGNWIFMVGVRPNGFKEMTAQKKFQLNKTNFKSVSALYGTNSDEWVGKEMQIKQGVANNPNSGEEVPALRLVPVGGADDEDSE